jgi:hypothetical protein
MLRGFICNVWYWATYFRQSEEEIVLLQQVPRSPLTQPGPPLPSYGPRNRVARSLQAFTAGFTSGSVGMVGI